jgi:hypothetical protein
MEKTEMTTLPVWQGMIVSLGVREMTYSKVMVIPLLGFMLSLQQVMTLSMAVLVMIGSTAIMVPMCSLEEMETIGC